MPVGDIGIGAISLADNQIQLLVRSEVTAEEIIDGDAYTTAVDLIEFAYIDRRTVRTGTIRGYNFDQGTVDEQYLSADPDNPTWHTIRANMRRFFDDTGGIKGGFTP